MSEDELDNWQRLEYRMDEEGFAYCFEGYSRWEEIKDEEFHRLRLEFLSSMDNLRNYVGNKIKSYESSETENGEMA